MIEELSIVSENVKVNTPLFISSENESNWGRVLSPVNKMLTRASFGSIEFTRLPLVSVMSSDGKLI